MLGALASTHGGEAGEVGSPVPSRATDDLLEPDGGQVSHLSVEQSKRGGEPEVGEEPKAVGRLKTEKELVEVLGRIGWLGRKLEKVFGLPSRNPEAVHAHGMSNQS